LGLFYEGRLVVQLWIPATRTAEADGPEVEGLSHPTAYEVREAVTWTGLRRSILPITARPPAT